MSKIQENRTALQFQIRGFGRCGLSVQAGAFSYCSPKVNGLTLDSYSSVEIALLKYDEDSGLLQPSEINNTLKRFDQFWEDDTVAAYISVEDVKELIGALKDLSVSCEASVDEMWEIVNKCPELLEL